MNFTMPDQLPSSVAELDALTAQATAEINVFSARVGANDSFTHADARRLEYLLASRDDLWEAAISLDNPSPAAASLEAKPRQGFQLSERLAHAGHEAGHAVIAVLLGGEVDTAEVFRLEQGAPIVHRDGRQLNGHCQVVPLTTVTEARRHLVAAAGPVAEAIARFGPSPTPAQIHQVLAGQPDFDELRRYALTAGAYASDPVREVLPLVLRCWPAIVQLAVQMDDGRAVTHADVAAALGLSADRSLHGFECANIRAGLRSVGGAA